MRDLRRTTLRVDAGFLAVAGLFGLVGDVLSYVSGAGPFGTTFYQNPTVIGVVDARARRSDRRHTLALFTKARGYVRQLGGALCPPGAWRVQHDLV